mgnify:FL=1
MTDIIRERRSDIQWCPSWRIIPNHLPKIQFFEKIAPADDWDELLEIEAMTDENARHLKDKIGNIEKEDRLTGPNVGPILAPFIFYDSPGRFNGGTKFGAYYAAKELITAIAETIYHRERFLRATKEKAQNVENIAISADLKGVLNDVRGMKEDHPDLYHPEDYSYSQSVAKELKNSGSLGVVYDSVRHGGGECVAIFKPRILSNWEQQKILVYQWDGSRIVGHFEKINETRFEPNN